MLLAWNPERLRRHVFAFTDMSYRELTEILLALKLHQIDRRTTFFLDVLDIGSFPLT